MQTGLPYDPSLSFIVRSIPPLSGCAKYSLAMVTYLYESVWPYICNCSLKSLHCRHELPYRLYIFNLARRKARTDTWIKVNANTLKMRQNHENSNARIVCQFWLKLKSSWNIWTWNIYCFGFLLLLRHPDRRTINPVYSLHRSSISSVNKTHLNAMQNKVRMNALLFKHKNLYGFFSKGAAVIGCSDFSDAWTC